MKTKKLLSMLLALCLLLTLLPAAVGAEEISSEPEVTGIQIAPISVIEGTGHTETDSDGNAYMNYDWYNYMDGIVSFADGSSVTFTNPWIEYQGESLYLSWEGDEQYASHWTVGNTYTVTVSLQDVSAEVQVTIVESPVASITAEPISMIEGSSGYTTTDNDGNEFFCYNNLNGTVMFKDGTSAAFDGLWLDYQGEELYLQNYDDQYENHWSVGNTYTVTLSLMGASVEIPVTVTESPVASITAEPISVIEGNNGYTTTDNDGNEFFYYHWYSNVNGTVVFKDGTSVTFDGPWLEYQGEELYLQNYDDQYENPWSVGNTYTVTLSLMGASAEVPVTITESPIASITADPISVIEGSSGYTTTDYDGNEFFYYNWSNELNGTVAFKDGTSVAFDSVWFEYQGEELYLGHNDGQYENPWSVGNTYTVTLSLMGTSVDIPITIIESPVESVAVEPIRVTEGTGGYTDTDSDGNQYYHYGWYYQLEGTVTFKDGTSLAVNGPWIEYNGQEYEFVLNDNQYVEHWSVGNTYTVDVSLMGASADVYVTVEEVFPIVSIEVDPITIVEETGGEIHSPYPMPEYYNYYWARIISGTVTFIDGTTQAFAGEVGPAWARPPMVEYNGEVYELGGRDNQGEEPWKAGNTYAAEVIVYGGPEDLTGKAEITIVHDFEEATCSAPKTCKVCGATEGDPLRHTDANVDCKCDACGETYITVTKVEFKPATLTIAEGTNGEIKTHFFFGDYWWYNWKSLTTVTVTFSDGYTMDLDLSKYEFEYAGTEYYLEHADFQSIDNWLVGTTNIIDLMFYDDYGTNEQALLEVTIVHDWVDATCTASKTCKACGETEGEALGHDYAAATCEAPKTCKACGVTEGAVIDHADANADNKCDMCGKLMKTVDIDTDGDGKADVNIDTDSDGKADVNMDRDGDSKADLNVDTDGDGKADENVDTDGDGLPNYEVVEGNNGQHDKVEQNDLTFKINGLISGFQGLELNGEPVAKENYEVVEGSTVVTLKASFLATLEEGEYTLTALYTDGKTDYSFAVALAEEAPTEPEATEPAPTVPEAEGPQTGDTMDFLPWIALLMLSAAGIVLCLILLARKRKVSR